MTVAPLPLPAAPLRAPGDWAASVPLYRLPAEVEALEAELPQGHTHTRAQLAWALRQQDPARATALAREVLAATVPTPLPTPLPTQMPAARQRQWARMQLVLGEAATHNMQLGEARQHLDAANATFQRLQDARGLSDVQWVSHYIAADEGEGEALRQHLQSCAALARDAGDDARAQFATISLARSDLFRDVAEATRRWQPSLPADAEQLGPVEAAALCDFWGLQQGLSSAFTPAADALLRAFSLSCQTGQMRRAVALAANLGFTYSSMREHAHALEWHQRALELARGAGWPALLSMALAQTGELLHRMGQTGAARELLRESIDLSLPYPNSRSALLALKYLGRCELDSDNAELALAHFELLRERAEAADSRDMRVDASQGCARALLGLGRVAEARDAALAGHAVLQTQTEQAAHVDICWALADIEARLGAAPQAVMDWLNEALRVAEQLAGYRPPAELLEAAAARAAESGDHRRAYALSRQAGAVRQHAFDEQANLRAAALHAQHRSERDQAERDHLRKLAEVESARAQALTALHHILLQLGDVGQEITAELSTTGVLDVLRRRLGGLLACAVLRVQPCDDQNPPPHAAGDAGAAAQLQACWHRRSELLLDADGQPVQAGTPPHRLVFPLLVNGRMAGLLDAESRPGQPFGEQELLIARNLCAYGAIALDNARAYERLAEAQNQLLQSEKMASIGQLAAGVAHEINNPIGFVNSNLGTLRRYVEQLLALVQAYASRARSAPDPELDALMQAADLAFIAEDLPALLADSEDGLSRVRKIVQDLKDFSRVDHADWQEVDLNQGLESTLNVVMNEVKYRADVKRAYGPLPPVRCLAGQLNQVFMNLVVNAAHAMPTERRGVISLATGVETQDDRDWAWIEVTDDGCGMTPEVQRRIFEPFFTTKPVGQGTGLGLSMAFSIVQKHGGRIELQSAPGEGTRFRVWVPVAGPGA